MSISIPSAVMLCSEMWAYEIMAVLAGILGVVQLDSMTINFSIMTVMYVFIIGVQEASSALIGNCIGANNIPLAK